MLFIFVFNFEKLPLQVSISGRHDAIYSFIGRVSKTFGWKEPLIQQFSQSEFLIVFHPDLALESLVLMKGLLSVLEALFGRLDTQAGFRGSILHPNPEDDESASIHVASLLINYIVQSLHLWIILTQEEDAFNTITSDLSESQRNYLRSISLWELASTQDGITLAQALIHKMLTRFVRAEEANTFHQKTEELHRVCPLFHPRRSMLESKVCLEYCCIFSIDLVLT